jgi:predicted house-cleaning noncanonical NTP pyrophosphatase (MazG superfamily)
MGKRLVRDNALSNWVVPGAEHQVRPVKDTQEHQELLRAKLLEECGEVMLSGKEELIKELADVSAVLEALATTNGIEWGEVLHMVDEREIASGGFTAGMVWETSR